MKQYFGKYRGIVQDNKDPLKLGRVKCIVPDVFGSDNLHWAVSANAPFNGFWMLPSVGDQVWIEFERGEINLPIYTNSWYNNKNISLEFLKSYPQNIVIKGKSGTIIQIDDSTGDLTIDNSNNSKMEFKSDGTISSKNEIGGSFEIDKLGGITIQNQAGSKISVSPVGDISISSTTVINITSIGIVNINGSIINLG